MKDTLRYLVHETKVWTEITTLMIPALNDSDAELTALAEFVVGDLGVDVPLHFSAFHPDYRMQRHPADAGRDPPPRPCDREAGRPPLRLHG